MNNTNFRIRPYSKRELARLYFPDTVNEESAIANLRNLMKHNPHLIAELKGAYYKTYNKTFTPRQIGSYSISVNRKRGLKPLVIHFPSR